MKAHKTPTIGARIVGVARSISGAARNGKRMNRGSPVRSGRPSLVLILLAGFMLSSLLFTTFDGVSPITEVSAFSESISTFDSGDCTTPKTSWDLGQTVCAVAMGSPQDRRIAWVAPNGAITQLSGFFSGTANDTYSIPTAPDPFAQVGNWMVTIIDNNGVAFAAAEFVVRDPNHTNADLSIRKYGPFQVSPGSNIDYRIELTNTGPDDAQNVALSDSVPANTTFVSETQHSGPPFTCTGPTPGSSTGTINCTVGTLPARATAIFTFVFSTDGAVGNGTIISNTAVVSSSTTELHAADNTASFSTTVLGAVASPCTITCPGIITVDNDPNAPDPCSVVVTYATPAATGDCADPENGQTTPVECSPPSGSAFPIGTTVVTCATAGFTCSFTVTVQETRPPTLPTIACPSDVSVTEEFPGAGSGMVSYPNPVVTGNCVSVICDPPSGSAFALGTTTVNCTATDPASNIATCTFQVTVTAAGPCTPCPSNITTPSDPGQCGAVVSFSSPTPEACGTVSCSPPSGSFFPVGTTTVNCTSSAGPSCSFTVEVTGQQLVTAGPAMIWIGLKNSDDVGTKFDLLAELFKNNTLIASGQLDGVPGGSSGFKNAVLRTIDLVLADPEGVCTGDVLSVRFSVRIAEGVPGHSSGTARLWFNDSAADSAFATTIGGVSSNQYLLSGFALGPAPGLGPKITIDVFVNRNAGGNPFKPFGTWSKTF